MLHNLIKRMGYSKVTAEELDLLRQELFQSRLHDSLDSDSTQVMDGFYSKELGYGTDNDKAEMFGIYRDKRHSRAELDALYATSGLIQKIVNLVVNDATRRGLKILCDESEMIKQQMNDLQMFDLAPKAAKYGRAFRKGYIHLDIDDGREPHEPVDVENIRTINSATVYDTEQIVPYNFLRHYNEPEMYMLTADESYRIHKDRLMIFDGVDAGLNNWIQSGGLHESVIDMIYKPFRNLDVDYNAAATLTKDFRIPIMKLEKFGVKAKGTPASEVKAAMARYKAMKKLLSVINGFVMGENDHMEYLTQNVNGYADLVNLAKDYLCMVTDIPHTKLFNHGTGAGLNNGKGESESNDWTNVVEDYQNQRLRKPFLKLFKYLAAYNGMDPFGFEFNSPAPMDPKKEAEVQKLKAETRHINAKTDAIYANNAVTWQEIRHNRFVDNLGDNEDRFTVEGEIPQQSVPAEQQQAALDSMSDLLRNANGLYIPQL